MESELSAWIAGQAWVTGDGPKAILEGAIAWLRDRQALLPGITTLERFVAEGRQAADRRMWRSLADQVIPEVAGALLALLDVPEGKDKRRRVSELERLRRGVFRSSSKGMVAALRAQGYPVLVEDVPRLSPFVRHHISIDGHYSFHLPDLGGSHRPWRDPDAEDDA